MYDLTFHRNRVILLGCLFLAIAFTGCAANGQVKGGGTIIGNPNIPALPTVPEEKYEGPFDQDSSDLVAQAELRSCLWTRFLPATLPLQTDPFAPILTQIWLVRQNLNNVYGYYFQNYLRENFLRGNFIANMEFSKFGNYQ